MAGTSSEDSHKKKKKKRTPDWAMEPFERVLDQMEEADQILHLSTRGISVLRAMPQVVEAIAQAKPHESSDGEDPQARLERAKKEADLAQREVDRGFPLLHSQAVISLWGSLEDVVRTFLAKWLRNEPSAKQVDALRKLKICLGEYESMDEEDRCFYIVDRLQDEIASPLRRGVSRFESLLEPFGLSGSVDKDVQRNLYELYHVRNVLVHRSGLADRKLVEACPWLDVAVGDEVTVSHEAYAKYHASAAQYVLDLIVRVAGRFGFERHELVKDTSVRGPSSLD